MVRKAIHGVRNVEFAREQEASGWWSVLINILESRANSGFYRVLLKLLGMCTATGYQGCLAVLRVCMYGF